MIHENKNLLIYTILLIVTLIFFDFTNFDIAIQNYFFNFESKTWIVDREDELLKLIFYDGIKVVLALFFFLLLSSLIFFRKKSLIVQKRGAIIIVLISMVLVPAIVGGIKAISNTPCPKNIDYYGGEYPNVKVFDSYPKNFNQNHKIKCFPAGHSSGGFALLSLVFLFDNKNRKKIASIFALTLGWSMGLYKMLIGDHYLSHTIVSMLIAWIVISLISKIVLLSYKAISLSCHTRT